MKNSKSKKQVRETEKRGEREREKNVHRVALQRRNVVLQIWGFHHDIDVRCSQKNLANLPSRFDLNHRSHRRRRLRHQILPLVSPPNRTAFRKVLYNVVDDYSQRSLTLDIIVAPPASFSFLAAHFDLIFNKFQ